MAEVSTPQGEVCRQLNNDLDSRQNNAVLRKIEIIIHLATSLFAKFRNFCHFETIQIDKI